MLPKTKKNSQKRILKNYFSSRYQKRKLFSLKRKRFFFQRNKKIKENILNSLRIFEEEVYYALALALALKLAI